MPAGGAGINAGFAYVELRLSDTDLISGPMKRQAEDAGEKASKALGERLVDGVKNAVGKIDGVMTGIGVAGGAALSAGFSEALNIQAGRSKLQAQLGLTAKESERIGNVAGKVFAGAYGESMEEVNDAIKSVVQNMDGMKNASSESLQKTTQDALNLASILGEDVSAVTRGVSNLLRTGLAKSAKEAFDILTVGAQNGANKAEDLLDTFNEYSVQFKKLGIDGQTALGLITQGLKAGARDGDLVADAFKEFSLLAISGADSVVAAYKELGLNADLMRDKIASGGPAAKEALGTVLDRLRAVKNPADQAALATSLFGTQAEDLGAALFALDPRTAVAGLGQVAGAADKVDQALGSSAAATFESFKRQLQTSVVAVIVSDVLPAMQSLIAVIQGFGVTGGNVGQIALGVVGIALAWKAVGLAVTIATGLSAAYGAVAGVVSSVAGAISLLTVAIRIQVLVWQEAAAAQGISTARVIAHAAAQRIAAAATAVWSAAQTIFNAVMSANPIALVIIAVVALVAAIVIAYKNSETFRAIVDATWAAVKQAFQSAWDFIRPILVNIGNFAVMVWTTYIQPAWTALMGFITNTLIPGFRTLWTVVQTVWNAISTAINIAWAIIQPIFNAIRTVIETVLIVYFKLIQFWFELVWFAVRVAMILAWRIIEGIWALIKIYIDTVLLPVFRLIQTTAKIVWDAVLAAIRVVWAAIEPIWTAIYNAVKEYIIDRFTEMRIASQIVWQALQGYIKAGWDYIQPIFAALKAGVALIPEAFRLAVDAIAKFWDGLKAAAKAPVKFVIDTVYTGGIKAIWDRVAGLVDLPKMPDAPAFARGGIMPGYAPGRDSLFAHVSPGEAIMRPEFTKAVGAGWIHRVNALARTGRSDDILKLIAGVGDPGGVPGFAGSFDIGGIVGGFFGSAKNFFADGFMKVAKKAFDGILGDAADAIGGNPYGQLILGIPKKIIASVMNIFKANEGKVGGNIGAVNAIRSQIGTPYSWGGGGPYGPTFGSAQGAGIKGYDCSSLMQYGEYQANKKIIPRTTYTQRPWLKPIPGPVPGAIGQPSLGHTFMATEKGTVVEAPYTGEFVREVPMRSAPFWGLPPYRADTGSALMPGLNPPIYNGTGRPEPILNPRQMSIVERALSNVEDSANDKPVDNSINVYPQRADFTIADLEALEARRDALARVGRPR
jgi:phage-related minor tail protein